MTILDVLKNTELEPIAPARERALQDGAPPAVEFRQVTKRYGAVVAVDTVDFVVTRGSLVTLLGPSGCGKTTTLRLIAGLEMASDGRLLIDGEDVTHRAAYERDVSMVFQSYALFPHMTVMENVSYGLQTSGLRRREIEAMAAEKHAWRSPGPSCWSRRCCSSTSRCRISTPSCAAGSAKTFGRFSSGSVSRWSTSLMIRRRRSPSPTASS
jgi:ABC-type glutathione transport system ATPase component